MAAYVGSVPPATLTTLAQREVELSLLQFLRQYHPKVDELWRTHPDAESMKAAEKMRMDASDDCKGDHLPRLHRELHDSYVRGRFLFLGESTQGLYNSQPWLAFWALQAADTLDITEKLYEHVSPDALGNFILGCLQEVKKSGTSNDDDMRNNPMDIDEQQESVLLRNPVSIFDDDNDDGKRLVGFAGGQLAQIPHLAASYAALCSLCILPRKTYLHALPRAAIKRWILSLRCKDGSFCLHTGGEADIRASYCAAVMTVLLQLNDVPAYTDGRDDTVLTEQTAAFVASCQTHEGGFACGLNASEAHGAYTQCGLAALILMRSPHLCKYAALRRWLSARQLKFEGGFNGRTNKLVDSCYSYWVGASHMLLRVGESYMRLLGQTETPRCLTAREALLLDHAQLIDTTSMCPRDDDAWRHAEEIQRQRTAHVEAYLHAPSQSAWKQQTVTQSFLDEDVGDFYFNQRRLLLYVLSCCQDKEMGGLMDKPGCLNDAYHTCYSLSGMSTAQNLQYLPRSCTNDTLMYATALRRGYIPNERDDYEIVLAVHNSNSSVGGGCYRSQERLPPLNPIFNICQSRVLAALRTWGVKSFIC
ncbi:protein farnesyltransferase, putative [Trypanosoma cruzi]|nr:protein farnesyltransferase, putative [Trypanosoma cruzi]